MNLIKTIIIFFIISGFLVHASAQSNKPTKKDSVNLNATGNTGDNYFGEESHDEDTSKTPEIEAGFRGGDSSWRKFVVQNFIYPVRCQEEGISGFVRLRFIVDRNGRISDIRIMEETKSCPEFSLEAIRILKMSPNWIPAQIHGQRVKSYRVIAIQLKTE